MEACAEQCRQAGATVITAQLDVRDAGAVAAWLTAFDDAHPLDLLIANAGVANTLSSASDWEDLARTREVFDTNFYGAFHTLLPVLARLRARKRGHVAVISSLAAIRGMAKYILEEEGGRIDLAFIEQHTAHFDDADKRAAMERASRTAQQVERSAGAVAGPRRCWLGP